MHIAAGMSTMNRFALSTCWLVGILLPLAAPGCQMHCTVVGCAENLRWTAELPADLTFDQARTLEVRACRNSQCFERSFSEVEPDSSGTGVGVVLSPVGDDSAYVIARIDTVNERLRISITWNADPVADGDVYAFDVTTEGGDWIAGRGAGPVDYVVYHPNGPDCPGVCLSATLEGSSQ